MRRVDIELVAGWLTSLDDNGRAGDPCCGTAGGQGPKPGCPLVDTVNAPRHRNMKELRPGSSGRSELRVLFAFDPTRHAILLVAGDKAGSWKRWYRQNIPVAGDLFDDHLRAVKGE